MIVPPTLLKINLKRQLLLECFLLPILHRRMQTKFYNFCETTLEHLISLFRYPIYYDPLYYNKLEKLINLVVFASTIQCVYWQNFVISAKRHWTSFLVSNTWSFQRCRNNYINISNIVYRNRCLGK